MPRCLCRLGLGGQEGCAGGHTRCLGRRISGPNLRSKWMRADTFRQRCLFGSSHWADYFVRADAFGSAVSVWVGPPKMPLLRVWIWPDREHQERALDLCANSLVTGV
jgi:hypothetical protein